MANKRHECILSLILQQDITTQEQLKDLLAAQGFPVTQATISRDIRQLQLRKEPAPSGGHRYCRPTADTTQRILTDMVKKVDHAMNTVVLLCHAGTAQAACARLDALELPEIVGTIAGDDTIFVLTRSEQQARTLAADLQSHIWGSSC